MASKNVKSAYELKIEELNRAFKAAAQQIKIANSEFKAASAGMEDWSKNADGVSAKLKQLNSNLDNEKKKLENLEEQLKETALAFGENSNEAEQFAIRVNNQKAKVAETEKAIRKYEDGLRELTNKSKTAEKNADNLSDKIEIVGEEANISAVEVEKFSENIGSKLPGAAKAALKVVGSMGVAIGGLTAAFAGVGVAGGKHMVGVSDNLNIAMNNLSASTGIAKSELRGYEQVLKNIYADNYAENFEEISDGISHVRKNLGDMSDKRLQNVTESAFALRDTFQYEIPESTRAAKAMIDNFNLSAEESYSLIASGAQNGLDYSGEFLDSIIEYSPQFKKVGLDAYDMFAIFQQGADSGAWNLDKVGDAVKEFSIRAIDGSDSTKEGFEAIGLGAEEMSAKFGKGGDTAKKAFKETVKALSSIEDPLKKDAAGVALFGTMWEDLGADVIAQLGNIKDGAYSAGDALNQIKEVKYDDLGSMFESLVRKVEILALPLGEMLIPAVEDFINLTSSVIESGKFESLVSTFSEFATGSLKTVFDYFSSNVLPIFEEAGEYIGEEFFPIAEEIAKDVFPIAESALKTAVPLIKGVGDNLKPILKLLKPIIEIASVGLSEIIEMLPELTPAGLLKTIGIIKDDTSLISEEYLQMSENADKMSESIQVIKDENKEVATEISNEYDGYRKLAGELDTLIGKNGEIKTHCETRVKQIIEQLNPALGTSLEIVDGQLQGYKDISAEIDNIIAKQQAQAILEAGAENYNQLVSDRATSIQEKLKAESDIKELEKEYAERERNAELYTDYGIQVEGFDFSTNTEEMLKIKANITECEEIIDKETENIENFNLQISTYEGLNNAVFENSIGGMKRYTEIYNNQMLTAGNATLAELTEQHATFAEMYDQMVEDRAKGDESITDEMLDQAKQRENIALDEKIKQEKIAYDTARGSASAYNSGMTSKTGEIAATSSIIGNVAKNGLKFDGASAANESMNSYASAIYGTIGNVITAAQTVANTVSSVLSNININVNATPRLSTRPIQKTATGGIVTRAQVRMVGEDGAEAIVPLEKNTHWIDLVAEKVAVAMNGSVVNNSSSSSSRVTNNYNQTINSPKTLSGPELYRQTKRLLNYNKGR